MSDKQRTDYVLTDREDELEDRVAELEATIAAREKMLGFFDACCTRQALAGERAAAVIVRQAATIERLTTALIDIQVVARHEPKNTAIDTLVLRAFNLQEEAK